jgi:hypothetical protein
MGTLATAAVGIVDIYALIRNAEFVLQFLLPFHVLWPILFASRRSLIRSWVRGDLSVQIAVREC